jgi:hypothetical protein
MGPMEYLIVQEFLRVKERFVGGKMTRWSPIHPLLPPLTATILGVEEIRHKGTDYRDIVVKTDDFQLTSPDGTLFAAKDYEFNLYPDSASICQACADLWVVAVPLKGFVHLQYRAD